MQNESKELTIKLKNERITRKAIEKFKPVPFCQEYKPVANVASSATWLSNLFSFSTQWFGIWFLTFLFLQSKLPTWLAMFLSVTVGFSGALGIEALKRVLSGRFLKKLFWEGFSVSLGAVNAVVVVLSIGLSFFASLFIPNLVTEKPQLADVAALKSEYDQQITDKKNERDTYRENRLYLGKLRKEEAAQVVEYNKEIDAIIAAKAAASKAMATENNKTIANWVESNNDYGLVLGFAMAVFELIFWIAISWVWYYDYRVAIEAGHTPSSPTPPTYSKKREGLNKKDEIEDVEIIEGVEESEIVNKTGETGENGAAGGDYHTIYSYERMYEDDNKEVKRLKDLISKSYQRSFSSAKASTRRANRQKSKNLAEELAVSFGMEANFNHLDKRVLFSHLQEAG